MREKIKKLKYEDWFGIFFLLAAFGMLIISVRLCFAEGIWYDELYTLGLTKRSFGELTAFTARDVHPPFYYYYVKIITELCKIVSPEANPIIIGKLCSVLPIAGLFGYGMTRVRRRFGLLCGGIFAFCVIAMPNLPQYTVEIRMYTTAMFLVTAAFLHAYEITCAWSRKEKGKGVDWVCLTVYGILAAYTHYFACVAAALVYFYLLVRILLIAGKKKEEKKGGLISLYMKRWGICVGISVICYMPWMFVAVKQMSRVKENYWILPLTWRIFGSCVKFMMKPPFGTGLFQVIAAVALFMLYIGLLVFALRKNGQEGQNETSFMLAGPMILGGVVLFGFIASLLLRPIFIVRYMLPALGCFWLSFSVFFSKIQKKQVLLFLCLLLLILGIGDYRWFRNDETWRRERMEEAEAVLEEIEPGDAIITQFNHVQGILGYYVDNAVCLWNSEPEELLCDIIEDKYTSVNSPEEIEEMLNSGKTVWFIGNRQADLLKEWEAAGIGAEEEQEFMIEIYWATLYKLYVK